MSKLKISMHQRTQWKGWKKQLKRCKDIFINHVPDKGLISKIFKELKLNDKINNLMTKIAKRLE